MKNIRHTIAFVFGLFLLVSGQAFAQGVFEFQETSHDFGTVEEGEKATKTFTFKNVGDQPIILSNVRASCGCTTPEWTREPVLPGKTGKVTAVYNSSGRPGAFNKTITITSNASTPNQTLVIRGNVVRDPANDPKMVVDRSVVALGKIKKGEAVSYKLSFKNEGKMGLQVHNLTSKCNCVRLASRPYAQQGETKELEIIITPTQEGQMNEEIVLYTNSRSNPRTTIKLTAEVVESATGSTIMRKENSGF